MNEDQEHLWHIELDSLRAQLRFVMDNLNDLSKRHEVKGKIENIYFTIDELCEQTKGEEA